MSNTQNVDYIKQVIVVRKDLKMPPGKLAAQVAHASMAVILNAMTKSTDGNGVKYTLSCVSGDPIDSWISGSFTKVVVGVESEQELERLYQLGIESRTPCSRIVDEGRTTFNGIPTLTCCAFGPAPASVLDAITGNLKLYTK